MNWKQQMKELKLEHLKNTAPGFFEASGGRTMKVNSYSDNKRATLRKSICDFIQFHGGHATPIQGQTRKVDGKLQRTWSTDRKLKADIHCIIKGRYVSVEIQISTEKANDGQHKEATEVRSAGGLYFIAKSMPGFIDWYDENFQNLPI
jgi:hypothetical protein